MEWICFYLVGLYASAYFYGRRQYFDDLHKSDQKHGLAISCYFWPIALTIYLLWDGLTVIYDKGNQRAKLLR